MRRCRSILLQRWSVPGIVDRRRPFSRRSPNRSVRYEGRGGGSPEFEQAEPGDRFHVDAPEREDKSIPSPVLFAELLAKSGVRTLLVDGDLRNPSLTRALASNAKTGVLEISHAGNAKFADIVRTDPLSGLDFLPAVVRTRVGAFQREVIGSDAMKQMFDDLLRSYDYIIVDLSPLAPVVDVAGNRPVHRSARVFVVEWERTKIEVAQRNRLNEIAKGIKDMMLGVVPQQADISRIGRYVTD